MLLKLRRQLKITIFHNTYNSQTDTDVWTPIVVENVSWFERTDTAITDNGLKSAKKCTIRIPVASIGSGFAIDAGDIIVKGTCADSACTNPVEIKKQYDGRVTIGTEMDLSGFEKGSEKLKTSVSGLVNAINGIAQTMEQAFGKHWKMPEPDLPEPEEMELTQPDPIKPEVDTSDFDAGTKKIHEDMKRIIRDVGSDLPEPKPIEPELDSEEFDDQARRMQTSISRVVREIDRMVSTSAQGFQSTASVLAFNNKLDLTSEKIAEAREQLALFASQQIPTDQYAETTKSIEKAENALLK